MIASPLSPRRTGAALLLGTMLAACFSAPAMAAPVVGFTEDFPGTSTSTWAGGSLFTNPGTGGFGGVGDGYLDVSTISDANLGTVSFGAEYAGDWTAAGIAQVRCRLRDTGGTGNLEIHLSITGLLTSWQQDAGLVPPIGSWGEYVVDMNAADFTQIRGVETFATVMANVDRLHFRHDVAPFGPTPDPITGGFGLDHIQLTDGANTAVGPGPLVSHPVLLAPPYPNPAHGRVTFQIQQPESHPVTLTVLDAAGRQVREETLAMPAGSSRLWLWDGADDAGRALPAGVYRVIARGVNGGMARTVTLLR